MKKITKISVEWLCAAKAKNSADLDSSNLASVRLRTAIGYRATQSTGFKAFISDKQFANDVDIIVVGKLDYVSDSDRADRWYKRIEEQKAQGARILIDYTDHHLVSESPAKDFYKKSIQIADLVITPSNWLRQQIKINLNKDVRLIPDPVEVPICMPVKKNNGTKTALWFGHATNLPYLFEYLVNRYYSKVERKLIIMTNLHPLPSQYIELLDLPHLSNLEINVVPWSKADLPLAAQISDFCLLPAGVDDVRKKGASSNRLLTSLALGLPTVAHPLDSYLPFSRYFSDLQNQNLDDFFDEPEKFFPAVEQAQKVILAEHTLEMAKVQWENLLQNAVFEEVRSKKNRDEARIFQISYSPEIRAALDRGFEIIGDEKNPRPEWYEYWHIRNFLLSEKLDEKKFYGFFSPKFGEKTNLHSSDVFEFINKNKEYDVILFSPYLDQIALFTNIIEQGCIAHPELKPVFKILGQKYFNGLDLDLMVNTSADTVFCNYFVAKAPFWHRWFLICEDIYASIENHGGSLSELMAGNTRYKAGSAPIRTFAIERIATLILAFEKSWKVQNYSAHRTAVGKMSVAKATNMLLALDALKSKYVHTGKFEYISSYLQIRKSMLNGFSPAEFESPSLGLKPWLDEYTNYLLDRFQSTDFIRSDARCK